MRDNGNIAFKANIKIDPFAKMAPFNSEKLESGPLVTRCIKNSTQDLIYTSTEYSEAATVTL